MSSQATPAKMPSPTKMPSQASKASSLLPSVCFAGHSFLKPERIRDAFPDFEPLLVSHGGFTYRELIDGGRSQQFRIEIQQAMSQRGGTILMLILGDNDFSLKTPDGIAKCQQYEEMMSNPAAVVKAWRDKAHEFAVSIGASHVVLSPIFPRFFIKTPDDEPHKVPRGRRAKKAFYDETSGLPWSVDHRNWHNLLAKQVNRMLTSIIGTEWRIHFRAGCKVSMAVLDSDPLEVAHPKHYTEWGTRFGRVQPCIHPNSATFSSYIIEPLKTLLESKE